MLTRGYDIHRIGHFHREGVDRLPVDLIDDRAKQGIRCKHEQGTHHRFQQQVSPSASTYRSRPPERCSGIESADVSFFSHDDASAKEANARDHIGNDADSALMAVKTVGHIHKNGRTYGDQDIGPQASRPLAVLPFDANQTDKKESGRSANRSNS